MKHLFIINPVAGGIKKNKNKIISDIQEYFKGKEAQFEIYQTTAPMDAAVKIEKEASSGEELRVYACGGDGTLNECVNGAAYRENVSVAPFPVGTGNDFIKTFGQDALSLYRNIDVITQADAVPIDLIDCCGRYCVNICSVGIDARIGTDVHKYSRLPIIGGATGYVTSLAVNLARGVSQRYTVQCGDYSRNKDITLICACNGTFYGGGFNPVPGAKLNDGIIDFLVVGNVSRIRFLNLVGKYAKGKYADMPELIEHLQGRHMTITAKEPIVVNVDGEALYSEKIDIHMCSEALRLIVPDRLRSKLV